MKTVQTLSQASVIGTTICGMALSFLAKLIQILEFVGLFALYKVHVGEIQESVLDKIFEWLQTSTIPHYLSDLA